MCPCLRTKPPPPPLPVPRRHLAVNKYPCCVFGGGLGVISCDQGSRRDVFVEVGRRRLRKSSSERSAHHKRVFHRVASHGRKSFGQRGPESDVSNSANHFLYEERLRSRVATCHYFHKPRTRFMFCPITSSIFYYNACDLGQEGFTVKDHFTALLLLEEDSSVIRLPQNLCDRLCLAFFSRALLPEHMMALDLTCAPRFPFPFPFVLAMIQSTPNERNRRYLSLPLGLQTHSPCSTCHPLGSSVHCSASHKDDLSLHRTPAVDCFSRLCREYKHKPHQG